MSEEHKRRAQPVNQQQIRQESVRIARWLSRAGTASRRQAEVLIAEGRVRVNGKTVMHPAMRVAGTDRVDVDGTMLAQPGTPRMWRYHKPAGLVTTSRDPDNRATVFDSLPPEMPRVMSVGRLDINSEGLLLLVNDGGLKRNLELPANRWLRRYRVRVRGNLHKDALDALRAGLTVAGTRYRPMDVAIERHTGSGGWLSIGLREGKNREIRRALAAVGLGVSRLIRIGFGPFKLGTLQRAQTAEVPGHLLRKVLPSK